MILNQSENIALLQEVYKNTCIGVVEISKALNNVEDELLQKDMESTIHELRKIQMRAGRSLGDIGGKIYGPNLIESISCGVGTAMKTKIKSDSQSIAKAMLENNQKNTCKLEHKIKNSKKTDSLVLTLAKELLSVEKQFENRLLTYAEN